MTQTEQRLSELVQFTNNLKNCDATDRATIQTLIFASEVLANEAQDNQKIYRGLNKFYHKTNIFFGILSIVLLQQGKTDRSFAPTFILLILFGIIHAKKAEKRADNYRQEHENFLSEQDNLLKCLSIKTPEQLHQIAEAYRTNEPTDFKPAQDLIHSIIINYPKIY